MYKFFVYLQRVSSGLQSGKFGLEDFDGKVDFGLESFYVESFCP